jgi:hypothetical protein
MIFGGHTDNPGSLYSGLKVKARSPVPLLDPSGRLALDNWINWQNSGALFHKRLRALKLAGAAGMGAVRTVGDLARMECEELRNKVAIKGELRFSPFVMF